jgi:hypothetical protein
MAVTCSRYTFLIVSITKRLHKGRFNSETAARRFQKQNRHLDPEDAIAFQGGGDGPGYRTCMKYLGHGDGAGQGLGNWPEARVVKKAQGA